MCSICLEEINENGYTTLCGHTFHKNCLSRWFNTDLQRTTCPLCREDIIYDRGINEYYSNLQIKKIINVEGQIMFYSNGNIKHNIKINRILNRIISAELHDESNNNIVFIPYNLIQNYQNKLEHELNDDNYNILENIF